MLLVVDWWRVAQQVENALVQLLVSSDAPVSGLLPGWKNTQIWLGGTTFWEDYAEKVVQRKWWTYLHNGESVADGFCGHHAPLAEPHPRA